LKVWELIRQLALGDAKNDGEMFLLAAIGVAIRNGRKLVCWLLFSTI
jgi:hydroxymethylpyrimidine pyrophosphatase-like HAD family hydrolase